MQLKALTTEMVETYYADLLAVGKSTSLIRKVHMRLGSALKMAKRFGHLSHVVTDDAKVPSVRYRQGEVWEPDEVARFLVVAQDDGMNPIWRLAMEGGARTSELLGVRWADFDPERGTIRFGRQVVRLDRGTPIIRSGGKTAAAERTNKLTPELVEAMREHGRVQNVKRMDAPEWIGNNLIFCTASGRPINAAAFRRSFSRLCEDAEVPNIAPHGMRRTAITLAIAGGGNVKAVSRMVGHADIATTIGIYQRITQDMDVELQSIMSGIVSAKSAQVEGAPIMIDSGAS